MHVLVGRSAADLHNPPEPLAAVEGILLRGGERKELVRAAREAILVVLDHYALLTGGSTIAELLAVVTRKGQVTIPAEVRKALYLKRGDVVAFTIPDSPTGAATIRRAPSARASVVERTAGIFKSPQPALSPSQEREAAELAWAEEALTRRGD
jgi:AbrB family looped-hinge helix DNA binding protein